MVLKVGHRDAFKIEIEARGWLVMRPHVAAFHQPFSLETFGRISHCIFSSSIFTMIALIAKHVKDTGKQMVLVLFYLARSNSGKCPVHCFVGLSNLHCAELLGWSLLSLLLSFLPSSSETMKHGALKVYLWRRYPLFLTYYLLKVVAAVHSAHFNCSRKMLLRQWTPKWPRCWLKADIPARGCAVIAQERLVIMASLSFSLSIYQLSTPLWRVVERPRSMAWSAQWR